MKGRRHGRETRMEGEETKEEGDWKLSANQGRVKSTGGGAVDRGKTPRRARNPCETASSGVRGRETRAGREESRQKKTTQNGKVSHHLDQ